MHIFYVDESYDQSKFIVTALCFEDVHWRPAFNLVKQFRRDLKEKFGIYVHAELHAHSFVRDCSDGISSRKVSLAERRDVFERTLKHISTLPVSIFNVCLDVAKCGSVPTAHQRAVERLANRIQTRMKADKSHAVVVFDSGKEAEITKLVRRMSVFNYIPSAFGSWAGGVSHKNIVLDRLIEDPVFKASEASFFLQLTDFAAYALLKREVAATPFIARWGYDKLFPRLKPVLFLKCSKVDPDGIVR